MKIPLTLFVLFFSSSVIASDDLSGKKIVCYKKVSSSDTVYLTGFDFKNKADVHVYNETNNEPLKVGISSYKTSTSMIIIEFVTNVALYKISRKTLEVDSDFQINFSGNQCSLVSSDIKGIFLEYLREYKKDNLI